MNRLKQVCNLLHDNRYLYVSWEKAKRFGKARYFVFPVFAILPMIRIISGNGFDYIRSLKKNGYIYQLNKRKYKKDIYMYVPGFEKDAIQNIIVRTYDFFESRELHNLKKKYIREGDVCLDLGANIGNHTVYFAKVCNAAKVYAVEPVKSTFSILKKNIEINDLENKVSLYNYGLAEKKQLATVRYFSESNIGATRLEEKESGEIQLIPLDELDIPEGVDFIKIDVEGMEYELIKGGRKLIERCHPILFIEIFKENYSKVDALLNELGYRQIEKRDLDNYVYRYTVNAHISSSISVDS